MENIERSSMNLMKKGNKMKNSIKSLPEKSKHVILYNTLSCLVSFCVIMVVISGCAAPPHYSDPLADIGKVRVGPDFSSLSLGVFFSKNARTAITHVEENRKKIGFALNPFAAKELDPHYLTQGLNKLLENRFKDVTILKNIDEAEMQNVDLSMILDIRIIIPQIGEKITTVELSGIFIDANGSVIETISGKGSVKVGLTFKFKPASNLALKSFSENLDGASKLMAELKRRKDLAYLSTSQITPPTSNIARLYTEDDLSSSSITVPKNISFGKYHALVIGIDQYQTLPNLQTATNDARTVKIILERDYGFQTMLLLNATRADILTALRKLRQELTSQDNLLIYYAGHGWLDQEADQGYWLPVDATEGSEVNWISNTAITSALKAIEAKHILVVADSCYSGKLTRGIHIKRLTPNYLERIARKRARLVLSSGGLEPVADSGIDERHSVFAWAFLKALRENQGVMDGTGLFTRIRRLVMVNSEQTPEYADIRRAGHAGGDFLFVRKK